MKSSRRNESTIFQQRQNRFVLSNTRKLQLYRDNEHQLTPVCFQLGNSSLRREPEATAYSRENTISLARVVSFFQHDCITSLKRNQVNIVVHRRKRRKYGTRDCPAEALANRGWDPFVVHKRRERTRGISLANEQSLPKKYEKNLFVIKTRRSKSRNFREKIF